MTDTRKQINTFRTLLKKMMHRDAIALRRELDRLVRSRKKLADADLRPAAGRPGAAHARCRCPTAAAP
jgi:hypothetical protein